MLWRWLYEPRLAAGTLYDLLEVCIEQPMGKDGGGLVCVGKE